MYQLDSNASFLMAAGSETLATVLTHAVFQLLTNPRTLEKLTAEIRTKFTCAADINMSSVNGCKYLLGCIEETMRIQAPSPSTHPRYTNGTGAVIDGFQVPGNVAVGIPIYAACKSSLNFYDAESYVPERWTGEDPLYDHDLREAARVFSLGPRDCRLPCSKSPSPSIDRWTCTKCEHYRSWAELGICWAEIGDCAIGVAFWLGSTLRRELVRPKGLYGLGEDTFHGKAGAGTGQLGNLISP